MDTMQLEFQGTGPMLMHADRAMNYLFDEDARTFKQLVGKRKKTDEDQAQISRLEWELGMYFDPEIGPYIPAINVEACIRDGAKMEKRGEDVKKAVHVMEDKIEVQYKGPRDLDGLWNAGFRDLRTVGNQNNKVMRCRPKFSKWSIKFSINFDSAIFNGDDLRRCAELAGRYSGLCDYTPRFGRFDVVSV